jgi:type II secretory pathway pseudopilin PulG
MLFTRTNNQKLKKPQVNNTGFTIIELMIFVAVSLALFVSAMMLVGGRQHKTEFQTGVNELVGQLQSIANDVSTGNYERPSEGSCSLDPLTDAPMFGTVGSPGKSIDCIFIGRAVQFAPEGNANEYNVFSVVGRRQISPSVGVPKREIQSLAEANPRVFAPSTVRIPGGLELKYIDAPSITGPALVAFYTNFAQAGPSGGTDIESGARNARVIPIPGTNMGDPLSTASGLLENYDLEIPGQVVLCVEHGGAGMHALVRIGGPDGSATVNTRIQEGGC